MKRKIIFVHGMGVRKDARGIFTDIQKSFLEDERFKDIECIFTDLNYVNPDGNLVLNPLDVQAEIIKEVYEREKENSQITIIAHSQGCVVASLCDFQNLSKIFFLAPPTNNDLQRSIDRMKARPGTMVNLEGESIMARSDGSKTIIPKEYWQNRKDLNYLDCYRKLVRHLASTKLEIIFAAQDEIIQDYKIEEFQKLGEVVLVDGDHNFTDTREKLVEVIKEKF